MVRFSKFSRHSIENSRLYRSTKTRIFRISSSCRKYRKNPKNHHFFTSDSNNSFETQVSQLKIFFSNSPYSITYYWIKFRIFISAQKNRSFVAPTFCPKSPLLNPNSSLRRFVVGSITLQQKVRFSKSFFYSMGNQMELCPLVGAEIVRVRDRVEKSKNHFRHFAKIGFFDI